MPGNVEDKIWQQQNTPPRMPVNEVPTQLGVLVPLTPMNPPPHPHNEPNRDWAWMEHQ